MRRFFLTTILLLFTGTKTFAAGFHCANPTELALSNSVKMKFCEIPEANDVLIGSPSGLRDERPMKPRNFKKFQLGQFEVTQLQYKTVTGSTPWMKEGKVRMFIQEGDENPAVFISYYEAQKFADLLNSIDKKATYRLPTEAEFEYAARSGTTTRYFWGDNVDPNFVYFKENSTTDQYARKVDSCPNTELNSKNPGYCANKFGLFHMLGNVWEWTEDAYGSYADASSDGHVAVKGNENSFRVTRGGSWGNVDICVRSADRHDVLPNGRTFSIGFRLVRTLK